MQRKGIIELCKRNNVLVDVRTVFITLFFYFQKKYAMNIFFIAFFNILIKIWYNI